MLFGVLGNISTGNAFNSAPGGIDSPPDGVIGGPQTQPPYHHFAPVTVASSGPPPSPAPTWIYSPKDGFPAAGAGSPTTGICPQGTVASSQGCLAACPSGTILDPGGSGTCVSPASSQGGSSGGSTTTGVTTSSTTGSSNNIGPGSGGPTGIMQSAQIPPCSAMPMPAMPGSNCGNPDGSVATIAPDGATQVTVNPATGAVMSTYTPAPYSSGVFGTGISTTTAALVLGGLALAGLYVHHKRQSKRRAA